MSPWTVEHSKDIVNDRWLKLQAQRVRTAQNRILEPYYVMQYPDWVNCVVVGVNSEITLIEQYRHGAGRYVQEIPAGTIEASETPEAAIRRELTEELGLTGVDIFPILASYANPAMLNNVNYSFILFGSAVTQDPSREPGEQTIKVTSRLLRALLKDIASNNQAAMFQSFHVAAIYAAVEFIKQSDHPHAVKLRQQLN